MDLTDINILFQDAKATLITMPPNYARSNARCVTMTPESVVSDIIQCLTNNRSKHTKRINRVKFMMKTYGHVISAETTESLREVLQKVKTTGQTDDMESLDALIAELSIERVPAGTPILFNKPEPNEKFSPPKKQVLHDACKKIVNRDGFVYNVFTAIAVISYKQLLKMPDQSSIREMLLSRSKLVLKGGAAIGKFLFKANNAIWNSLSEEDKQFVETNFINGGDNDMSIAFSNISTEYDVEVVNNEIGSMTYDLQACVLKNVLAYNVHSIIEDYLKEVNSSSATYGGETFAFCGREADSFAIADKNSKQNEIIFMGDKPRQIFGSLSYLEFYASETEKVKFHLARIKAAFTATMVGNAKVKANCYSELLDISIVCVDSAPLAQYEYQSANCKKFMSIA